MWPLTITWLVASDALRAFNELHDEPKKDRPESGTAVADGGEIVRDDTNRETDAHGRDEDKPAWVPQDGKRVDAIIEEDDGTEWFILAGSESDGEWLRTQTDNIRRVRQ